MKIARSQAKLSKQRLLTQRGYTCYAVNAAGVRDRSQADEEFGNFAVHEDLPRLIPKGEVWITERLVEREGIYFLANALTQLQEREKGTGTEAAYAVGEEVERFLRERLEGVAFRHGKPHKRVPDAVYSEPYVTLPDEKFPIQVWQIDGCLVRSYYKTDYTEGGHHFVYPWVPHREIWVEADLEKAELPYLIAHEYTELRLMRDQGLRYDEAHAIAAKVEYQLRQDEHTDGLIHLPRGKLTRSELPRLATPEFFAEVVRRRLTTRRKA